MATLRISCWVVLLWCAVTLAAVGNQDLIGIARDGDERVQYIEHHQYLDSGEHLINYYSPELTLLVEKKLSYPGLSYHPDIEQSDHLNDTEIVMQSSKNTLQVIKEQDQERSSWDFELTPDVVVDAGFDGYIREAWTELIPGETRIVSFAVAGQSRLIKMKIRDHGFENGNRIFVIEPKNWLVRAIVPRIRLEYSGNKQLVRYEGMSNIRAFKKGSAGIVDIRFHPWQGQLPKVGSDITSGNAVGRL